MIAIYVPKSWLNTIGDAGTALFLFEAAGEYVSLLATTATVNSLFVEAELYLKTGVGGDSFMQGKIPVGVVTGIFDLTDKQAHKLGFQPPAQKP